MKVKQIDENLINLIGTKFLSTFPAQNVINNLIRKPLIIKIRVDV